MSATKQTPEGYFPINDETVGMDTSMMINLQGISECVSPTRSRGSECHLVPVTDQRLSQYVLRSASTKDVSSESVATRSNDIVVKGKTQSRAEEQIKI